MVCGAEFGSTGVCTGCTVVCASAGGGNVGFTASGFVSGWGSGIAVGLGGASCCFAVGEETAAWVMGVSLSGIAAGFCSVMEGATEAGGFSDSGGGAIGGAGGG